MPEIVSQERKRQATYLKGPVNDLLYTSEHCILHKHLILTHI